MPMKIAEILICTNLDSQSLKTLPRKSTLPKSLRFGGNKFNSFTYPHTLLLHFDALRNRYGFADSMLYDQIYVEYFQFQ